MTMLGRVRRRQEEDDPTLLQTRPAYTARTKEFFKSIMVEAQRRQMECVFLLTDRQVKH